MDDIPSVLTQKYESSLRRTLGLHASTDNWVLYNPDPKDLPCVSKIIQAGNKWTDLILTYICLSDLVCVFLILTGKSIRDLHTFYHLDFSKEKIYKTCPQMSHLSVDKNGHFYIFKGYVLHRAASLNRYPFNWTYSTVSQEYLVQIVSPRANASGNHDATPIPFIINAKTVNIPKPQI